MTTTSAKSSNKMLLIFTFIVILALLVFGYIQLNKKNYHDSLVEWLKDNQITYKSLSVSNEGHFKITDAESSFSDNVKLISPDIEGDMSENTGVKSIIIKDATFSIYQLDFVMTDVKVVNAAHSSSAKDEPYMQNMHPFVKSLFQADIAEVSIEKAAYDFNKLAILKQLNDKNTISFAYDGIEFKNIKNGLIEKSLIKSTLLNAYLSAGNADEYIDATAKMGLQIQNNYDFNALMTFLFVPAQEKPELLQIVGDSSFDGLEYDVDISSSNGSSQTIKTTYGSSSTSAIAIMQQKTPISQWDIFSKEKLEQLQNNEEKVIALGLNALDILDSIAPFSTTTKSMQQVSTTDSPIDGTQMTMTQNVGEGSVKYTGTGFDYNLNAMKYHIKYGPIDLMDYSLDNLSMKNFHIPNLINNGKKLINDYQADKDKFNAISRTDAFKQEMLKLFMPRLDEFHLSGMEINSDTARMFLKTNTSTVFSIGSLDLKAKYPVSYIPTQFTLDAKDITIPTSLFQDNRLFYASSPETFALNNLGYDDVTFSTHLDLSWDEATKEMSLNNSTFDVKDMFTLAANFKIANVNEMLFSGEPALVEAAAADLSYKSFDLTTNIDPLREHAENWLVEQEQDPKDVYEEIAKSFNLGLIEETSRSARNNPELAGFFIETTNKLIKPVNDFILNGGTLEIIFNTKSENGLSLADFIGDKELSKTLLEKINFSAQTKH